MLNHDQLQQFREDGYVIIEGVIPSLLIPLRQAADRIIDQARAGTWQAARHCPDGEDIWGVSSLLHPDVNESVFAEYLASEHVLDVARQLLDDNELRLGLTNMLINPARQDYAIAWHRDSGDPTLTGEDELAYLNDLMHGVQWNAALYDEACLRIVPGSHKRNITDAERDVLLNHPLDAMPGELRVELKAGQTVYYNAMLLHKGDYPTATRRVTLHANFVRLNAPKLFPLHYHAVKFMEEPGFVDHLPERLKPLHANWLIFADRVKRQETEEARVG